MTNKKLHVFLNKCAKEFGSGLRDLDLSGSKEATLDQSLSDAICKCKAFEGLKHINISKGKDQKKFLLLKEAKRGQSIEKAKQLK